MDFHLSKEHEMLRKMYREFAQTEVKPLAEEIDETERFPEETVRKMAELGMMGIYFPKEYGGAGADVLAYSMAVEELAKVCGTTAVVLVATHNGLCCDPYPAQRHRGAEAEVPPDAHRGPEGRRFRPDRAQRRFRRVQGYHHRRAGGRSLRPQRL